MLFCAHFTCIHIHGVQRSHSWSSFATCWGLTVSFSITEEPENASRKQGSAAGCLWHHSLWGSGGISIRQLQLGCHTRQQHLASQELVLQSLQFGKVVVFCPLWSPLYILHQLYGWNSYPDTRWASALKRFGLALTPGKASRQGCQWALQSWGLLYIREECTHLSACPRPAAGATWENSGFLARSVTNSTW